MEFHHQTAVPNMPLSESETEEGLDREQLNGATSKSPSSALPTTKIPSSTQFWCSVHKSTRCACSFTPLTEMDSPFVIN